MNVSFHPLRDVILIEPIDLGDRSAGGVILSEAHKKKPNEGYVRAHGPGLFIDVQVLDDGNNVFIKREPIEVQVGDKVIYVRFSGIEVELCGKKFIAVPQKDILGVKVENEIQL